MKIVTVEFGRDGSVKIDVAGFAGGECLKETLDLERALGIVGKRTEKPEMRYTAGRQTAKQGQGR